jgi:hypothetical protein
VCCASFARVHNLVGAIIGSCAAHGRRSAAEMVRIICRHAGVHCQICSMTRQQCCVLSGCRGALGNGKCVVVPSYEAGLRALSGKQRVLHYYDYHIQGWCWFGMCLMLWVQGASWGLGWHWQALGGEKTLPQGRYRTALIIVVVSRLWCTFGRLSKCGVL